MENALCGKSGLGQRCGACGPTGTQRCVAADGVGTCTPVIGHNGKPAGNGVCKGVKAGCGSAPLGLEGTIDTTCVIDVADGAGNGALTCEADPDDASLGKWKITKAVETTCDPANEPDPTNQPTVPAGFKAIDCTGVDGSTPELKSCAVVASDGFTVGTVKCDTSTGEYKVTPGVKTFCDPTNPKVIAQLAAIVSKYPSIKTIDCTKNQDNVAYSVDVGQASVVTQAGQVGDECYVEEGFGYHDTGKTVLECKQTGFPGYQVTSVSTNKKEGYCTGLPTVDQAAMHFLVPACLGAGCPTVTCADNVNSCGATCAENVPCDVSGVGGVCGSDNICRAGEHDCTGGALNTACAACAADPLTQSTSCLASDGAGTCDGDKCMASKDCSNSKLGTKCRMCGGTKASCTANDGPGFCQVQGNICQGKVAGCQYMLGKVGERCDVDYDPGYTGGGAVCLANDASGGTWDGGVTEATFIDRFCAADSAKCKDDGPGGKINCAVHKPLDLSLFEEVDCDTFTSLDETCTTTPAYGFSGGAVKCTGTKKYEVTTEPTKLDGYCTSASTKTGDNHLDASEVFRSKSVV